MLGALLILPIVLRIVGVILGLVFALGLVLAIIAAVFALVFGDLRSTHWRGMPDWTRPLDAAGPQTSRSFPWAGGDTLRIAVPAEVAYVQSPTVALSITGPAAALDHIVIERGEIRYNRWIKNAGRLRITLSAPDVTRFSLADAVTRYATGRTTPGLIGSACSSTDSGTVPGGTS